MNNELTNLLIGGIAGTVSRTMTSPLEIYKMQRQNNYMKSANLTVLWREEGIRGLWKGNFTNCVRLFPQYGINYMTYKFCQPLVNNNFVAAAIAGSISISVIYPLETVRTRLALQINHSHYNGTVDALRKMTVKEYYRGLRMTLIGYTPFNALHFTFFEYYKRKMDYDYQFIPGALAGVSALSFTYPTDLIRRRLQLQQFSHEVPTYDGILDCSRQIIRKDGIQGLYRGLLSSYLKIFPSSAIHFAVLDYLSKRL